MSFSRSESSFRRTESCRSVKSEAAEQAFTRTVYRTPYSHWHTHVGEANGVISSLSNTERMFSYYPDLKRSASISSFERPEGCKDAGQEGQGASEGLGIARAALEAQGPSQAASGAHGITRAASEAQGVSRTVSSHTGGYHSDSEDRPPVRWRTSQGMALWGSLRQCTSSPNSHNTGVRGKSLQRQASSSTLSGARAGSKTFGMSESGEEVLSDGVEEMREGAATRSFGVNDCENLSDAMKRSLKALNMLPYKGPSGVGGPAASGGSFLYTKGGSDVLSPQRSELDSSASTARLVDRSSLVKKTSIAAEAALRSKDKKKENKYAQDLQEKRKQGTKPQRPTDLYGEFVRMRDCMDCGNGCGGIKVGFGGLGLLAEHVEKGLVTGATPLCIEIEFCTHGYDGVARGNKNTSKYYNHYMHVCDVIEDALYPAWNVAFIIKKGKPRAGSFEVELLWIVGSVEYSVTLASKMCNSKFPSAKKICNRLKVALGIEDKQEDASQD